MTALLSHPFRVMPAGGVATVEQDSGSQKAELLATLLLTRPGERPLVPDFGVEDPAFGDFDDAGLSLGCDTFGPEVSSLEVEVQPLDATSEAVTVTFEP